MPGITSLTEWECRYLLFITLGAHVGVNLADILDRHLRLDHE
jgi:hypothetical protein